MFGNNVLKVKLKVGIILSDLYGGYGVFDCGFILFYSN